MCAKAIVSDLKKEDAPTSSRRRPDSVEDKKETICFATRLS
jgi:hypothetical protein